MDLRDAFALAEDLLDHHGLTDAGWSLTYDSAKRRAGVCRFDRREIGLSAPWVAVNDLDAVRDTVLHEVAHALVGPRHGHDATWRRVAVDLGCSGSRCTDPDQPTVEPAWLGVCPAGHTSGRHRRPERVMTCGVCSRGFDLAHVLSWTHHGRPATMHPNYEAELAELRAGTRRPLLRVGSRATITAPGEFEGRSGVVVKRGRTSYHLRCGRDVVRVPFAYVEAGSSRGVRRRSHV
jgi:predicted SprT family Zn-dependent metalloprotease